MNKSGRYVSFEDLKSGMKSLIKILKTLLLRDQNLSSRNEFLLKKYIILCFQKDYLQCHVYHLWQLISTLQQGTRRVN